MAAVRPASTAIHYLLPSGAWSAWHRVGVRRGLAPLRRRRAPSLPALGTGAVRLSAAIAAGRGPRGHLAGRGARGRRGALRLYGGAGVRVRGFRARPPAAAGGGVPGEAALIRRWPVSRAAARAGAWLAGPLALRGALRGAQAAPPAERIVVEAVPAAAERGAAWSGSFARAGRARPTLAHARRLRRRGTAPLRATQRRSVPKSARGSAGRGDTFSIALRLSTGAVTDTVVVHLTVRRPDYASERLRVAPAVCRAGQCGPGPGRERSGAEPGDLPAGTRHAAALARRVHPAAPEPDHQHLRNGARVQRHRDQPAPGHRLRRPDRGAGPGGGTRRRRADRGFLPGGSRGVPGSRWRDW